jgi:FkbM family methyltransferase
MTKCKKPKCNQLKQTLKMSIRKTIRLRLIAKFPKIVQLAIERMYYGFHIRPTLTIIKHLCDCDKNSLDVGANEGDLTLFISQFSSHVYCFEPLPTLAHHLKTRFSGCNVTIENCALGNINEEAYLTTPCIGTKKYLSRSRLHTNFDDGSIMGKRVTAVEKIKVPVKKMDDFSIDNIGFLKIDVEGFELNVLKGGKVTIKRNMPNMYIEIEQKHLKTTNIYDIFQYILDLGYFGFFLFDNKIRNLDEFDLKLMQNVKNEKTNYFINNFFFIPERMNILQDFYRLQRKWF